MTKINIDDVDYEKLLLPLQDLEPCNLCPRSCNSNRLSGKLGYCKANGAFSISSICIHRGEEPPISGRKGICNIFFTNCNLQCRYCQNYQISDNEIDHSADKISLKEVIRQILNILNHGIDAVGFVSPTHFIPQVKIIINTLHELGINPTFVYNSNGYDKVGELRKFDGLIDVYLPDFKYMDSDISKSFSDASDYPQIATNAIKEMYRQVGSDLKLEDGQARKGMIIRHLVLPGHTDNSIAVLNEIYGKISPEVNISLMSQYFPTYRVAAYPDLGRTVDKKDYHKVVKHMGDLGMFNGWIQDMDSYENYRPDFKNKKEPFK